MDREGDLDASGAGPHDRDADGAATRRSRQGIDLRPECDGLAHGPYGHRVLPHARNVEAGRSGAHVDRHDIEGQARPAGLHGVTAHVDPLGGRFDEPSTGAGGQTGEVDPQLLLGVRTLEKAWHHPGVVVPGRWRHERDLDAGQRPGDRDRPGRGGGRDRRPPERAASRPDACVARPAVSEGSPLRTAPAAGALRTTPAGSGTARAGAGAGRSARARGPRPETGRNAPADGAS